jgi:hypothetical protein
MAPWLVTQIIYLGFLINMNKLVRFFLSGGKFKVVVSPKHKKSKVYLCLTN